MRRVIRVRQGTKAAPTKKDVTTALNGAIKAFQVAYRASRTAWQAVKDYETPTGGKYHRSVLQDVLNAAQRGIALLNEIKKGI